MNELSKKKLQNLLASLQTEAESLALKLEEYHKEIIKQNQMLDFLKRDMREDEYVFSPRASKGNNEEADQCLVVLEELKEKCRLLETRYNQINDYIDTIVDVLTSDMGKRTDLNGLVYHEQDRQRIARDLHETTLQNMGYLITKLDTCTQYIDNDPIKAKMELSIAKQNLRDTIDDIKSIIYNLRPMLIDSSGFQSVLQKLVDSISDEYLIESQIENISCENQVVLTSIYRIVEECFRNIVKHANAYRINFKLQGQLGQYFLYIEDDGKGFDSEKVELNDNLNFGLIIVKERVKLMGGTIQIESSVNSGTRISIYIPIA